MIAKGNSGLKAYVGSTGVSKMYLGDTLVYGGGEVVEEMPLYVASPIGGYMLTGLYPTKSYKVIAEFFTFNSDAWGVFWGCCQSSDNNEYGLQYRSDGKKVRRNINTNHYNNGSILPLDYYAVEMTSTYHIINGTRYNGAYSGAELSGTGVLTMGGRSDGTGVVAGNKLSIGWIKISIYNGSTLLRNYIPWKDDGGNYCLKDIVNNTLNYSEIAALPFEYTEYTHIDRANVTWKTGNINASGAITTYANQVTNFIVLPNKGCNIQYIGDSTYKVVIREYNENFEYISGVNVDDNSTGTLTLESDCRIIRLVVYDKPSSSYVTNTADFEFDVV